MTIGAAVDDDEDDAAGTMAVDELGVDAVVVGAGAPLPLPLLLPFLLCPEPLPFD